MRTAVRRKRRRLDTATINQSARIRTPAVNPASTASLVDHCESMAAVLVAGAPASIAAAPAGVSRAPPGAGEMSLRQGWQRGSSRHASSTT